MRTAVMESCGRLADPEKLDQVDEARTTVMSSPGHHQVIQLCMAPPKGPGNLTKLHLTSIKV